VLPHAARNQLDRDAPQQYWLGRAMKGFAPKAHAIQPPRLNSSGCVQVSRTPASGEVVAHAGPASAPLTRNVEPERTWEGCAIEDLGDGRFDQVLLLLNRQASLSQSDMLRTPHGIDLLHDAQQRATTERTAWIVS
jgi:hypothetical protein